MRIGLIIIGVWGALLPLTGCQSGQPQFFGLDEVRWEKLNAQEKQAVVDRYRINHNRSVRLMGPRDI